MPAPLRVSMTDVVAATRQIAESDGIGAVTMSSVAVALGIRPPSLYKKVDDRDGLLRLAADDLATDLLADVRAQAVDTVPLATLARIVRARAIASPRIFSLFFSPPTANAGLSPALSTRLLELLFSAIPRADVVDPLPSARAFTSWLYGFCILEASGAFQLEGSIDRAFEVGLEIQLDGLSIRCASR